MNSLTIALNMIKRVMGTKRGLFFTILLPVAVVSMIIGIAGGQGTYQGKIVYWNQDQGTLGAEVISALGNGENVKLVPVESKDKGENEVVNRNADVLMVVPPDFSASLLQGKGEQIRLQYLTQSEATAGIEVMLKQLTGSFAGFADAARAAGHTGEELRKQVDAMIAAKNQGTSVVAVTTAGSHGDPSLQMVIGFLMFFMMLSVSRTVGFILEDRSQQTMSRIYAAPVTKLQITFGNFLGSLLVGMLQILFLLLFTIYVVGFNYGTDFGSLFVILSFFMLAAMGIATMIANMARSQNMVGILNNLVITPSCMIGGCFWPVSMMPNAMQKLANFVPHKWAIEAIVDLSNGSHLSDIGLNLAILALFALVLLAFGAASLRPADTVEN
ncbi:ABC transporter permease [Gorillibacterium massiliense]|uniref:ABC transporter permease n=1 Tax=Gorillibacterium massiliense TaxID=1280390 RepID=UPI0004B83375|nr:ABC transporter permease [Gorillibacterium massiliense]